MKKVIIVGGGAAGMMCGAFLARAGNKVIIFEKNEKLGKKLFITGKGRCNLTNACDMEDLFQNVLTNRKFLYSAFYGFSNQQAIDYFESIGCATKIERGNRVFPVSDHSSDVIGALTRELKKYGAEIVLNTEITEIIVKNESAVGIKTRKEAVYADEVIVATGGFSYQSTGSTGDGYTFAKSAGHTIKEISPGLVPLNVKEDFVKELQGLSLKNVSVTIMDEKKVLYHEFGEMLFTHYGVSGPLILSGASVIGKHLKKNTLKLSIDLKPALTVEQLSKRVLREFEDNQNKQFKNSVSKLFPAKLIPVMIAHSGIHPDKKVNEITREERQGFVHQIKNFEMTIVGLRDYNEAIITRGGVAVNEVNPSTMESKLVSHMFFIGEVLDVDALTGGFNLQIAWSTAVAAAEYIGGKE